MKYQKVIISLIFLLSLGLAIWFASAVDLTFTMNTSYTKQPQSLKIKSIDTMKYSRDMAREKNSDSSFDEIINRQISSIAKTGATHVAIATPYDEEFIPFMRRWVSSARKNNLNIWFRGNFSGWEGWFGYPRITREEDLVKLEEFILKNPDLFEDGDIFTPCTECENGGPGDPRLTGDIGGFRKFLIDEYMTSRLSFSRIQKSVSSNFFSMNGDVANLIMDQDTTKKLDGIVVIDHYVKTPKQLSDDIKSIAHSSGGKVVLGEFGVPLPNIHGNLNEEEQKKWLEESTKLLSQIPELIGINYWVSVGGTTELWDDSGKAKAGVEVIKNFYIN